MNQKIASMVQDTIQAGKIEDSAKQNWMDMATKNFDLAKATLDLSLPEIRSPQRLKTTRITWKK